MGVLARCDGCGTEKPMTLPARGGGFSFPLPQGWKFRPGSMGKPGHDDMVLLACSDPCLIKVVDSGPGSGSHKLPPKAAHAPPTPGAPMRGPTVVPPKRDTKGKKNT